MIKYFWFILLLLSISLAAQENKYIKGDANIEFKWRLGYSEFPINLNSAVVQEDSEQGAYEWFDGYLWASNYKAWDENTLSGVSLLYRGGSPYARAIRCTSGIVPTDKAGLPVTFSIPMQFTMGSESRVSLALSIIGQDRENIVLNLSPMEEIVVTNGQSKISFSALTLNQPNIGGPLTQVSGMLHIRVYPRLLNYGGRMIFEFNSLTHHMDIGSGVLIGSLWKDVSQTDVQNEWTKSGLKKYMFIDADSIHQAKLINWKQKSKAIYNNLNKRGQVTVSCAETPKLWDRGELRVQAYSGNPVKDFQFGEPSDKMYTMAQSVVKETGSPFSLFRYQHHRLPWKAANPNELDPVEKLYIDKWLQAASASSDKIMLTLQLSPIMKEYKSETEIGSKVLTPEGLKNFPWEDIRKGYVTTLKYIKQNYPKLSIIQMPYEFDNMSDNECHRDAHYQFYKTLYRAVNDVNKGVNKDNRIQVAGLSINNPMDKWDFIDGFLKRYKEDKDPQKCLDYLTWHAYLFPRDKPNHPRGFKTKLQELLAKYNLPSSLPVIIDESGLAEPSTVEDLSDLIGAAKKEAAMACFAMSINDWYLKEEGNFIPVSGGGWHFGLLTYGKQDALSPYGKGMVLRNRLSDHSIPSVATPCDDEGYGLYSFATKDENSIKVLVWGASPSIFYEDIPRLDFNQTAILLKDIPQKYRNKKLKVSIDYFSPDDEKVQKVLSMDKCQTLPLTRGADRYNIDFTPSEIEAINTINSNVQYVISQDDNLSLSLDIKEHSMYLLTVEVDK